MTTDELERRVNRLEKSFTELAEELRLALRYVRPDAGSSLTKSRLILEKILVQLYAAQTGREPKKPLLGDMLADNQFTRHIDRRMVSRMNAIRDMGNLGPHGEPVEASDAARVLEDLCEVLDWYLQRIRPPVKEPPPPPPEGRRKTWRLKVAALAAVVLLAALGAWFWLRNGTDDGDRQQGAESAPSTAATGQPAPPKPAVVVELGLAKPTARVDGPPPADDADTRVTYEYKRKDGTLEVAYRLPYLEQQRAGKPIRGIMFTHVPFEWELPVLSVKVLNNTTQSVMVTECVVEVVSSVIDVAPVLAVADRTVNGVLLINEGWGDVIDPVLNFKIQRQKKGKDPDSVERRMLELPTFAKDKMVRLAKYVPKELEAEPAVTVSGELEFGAAKQRKKVPFTTTMIFDTTFEHPVPPSQEYDLALTAGKAPDTVRVPVAHNLKPGEADQFLLRVASDKSARYELKVSLRRIDDQSLPEQKLVLDVFVPRSGAKRVVKVGAPKEDKPAPPKKP
jgi:hypothetical protein